MASPLALHQSQRLQQEALHGTFMGSICASAVANPFRSQTVLNNTQSKLMFTTTNRRVFGENVSKRAHFREKRDKMCPNIAAGHWNMKNSVREKRNFSDEVTAAIRRIARNRKGPHQRPSEALMKCAELATELPAANFP